MKKHQLLKMALVGLLAIVGSGLFLSGCGKNSSHSDKINVISSVNFYGETAKAVLGSHGTVSSIIDNANIDPHDFQPTPQTAKDVAKANFIIGNGVSYDSWLSKLAKNNNENAKYIQVGNLMNKKDTDNPHLWYDVQTMPTLARQLAADFAKKDPDHKADFEKNAQKYIDSLKPIDNFINKQKKLSKGAKVAVSEPVFNYALSAMGYQVSDEDFAKSIENETDPSPAAIKNLQNDITNHKIKFFVYNVQTSDKVVKNMVNLANRHNVPVIKVTETMPNNVKSYKEWMMNQYKQMIQIK